MNNLPEGSSVGSEAANFVLLHLDEPRPGLILSPGGRLSGRGWIVADGDVVEISVHLGARPLCYATYGLPTPDIAERYPHYPHVDHAGFSFTALAPSDTSSADAEALLLHVRFGDGRTASHALPVRMKAEPDGIPPRAPSGLWPIRITLEGARLDRGGILRLVGWVASFAPLRSLQAFLGDELLGQPELEIERPDVAANHPAYPNAARSGFRLVQDVGALGAGQGMVRIQAVCEGGVRRQIMMPVDAPATQRKILVQDDAIHLCIDTAVAWGDGSVSVAGWAVSAPGIQAVAVFLDDAPIGDAELGRSRPDVGNRFPRIPDARRAGFHFARLLAQPIAGKHLLTVRVRNVDGEERSMHLPLQAEVLDAVTTADPEADDDIRFDVDTPSLTGDRAIEPARGLLTIAGWAVARSGIEAVEVALDDVPQGAAHVGIRREDIGGLFPDVPGALLAGYAFTLPMRLSGEHELRVTLRSRSGQVAERTFHVVGETPEESMAGLALRPRLTQAEAALGLSLLPRRPPCCVVVRAGDLHDDALVRISATLETLQAQAYPAWHALVLLPSGTDVPEPAATDLAAAGRVTVRAATSVPLFELLEEMPGVEPAAGEALLMVVSAGDRLGADALLRLVAELVRRPPATLVYGDERRHDPALDVVQPFFKPDWSPDLLLSMNYVGRAWCTTASVVRASGLAAIDVQSGRDYDAVLRLTEAAAGVHRVTGLLLDRGARGVEPADDEGRALEAAVRRRGLEASVLPGAARGTWRVRRRVAPPGLVSVVIPTCAAGGLIERAVRTLREHTPDGAIEIVCIDSIPAGDVTWKAWLRGNADVVVETAEAFNWSLYNNLGAAAARGEYLLFLNDDVEVLEPGWLDALLEHAQRPEVGLVGPKLLYPDGKVQHGGMFLAGTVARHAFRFAPEDDPGPFGLAAVQRNVSAVTGACMLMRRTVFDALGGFDEAHSVVNNDVDFCLRVVERGMRVIYTPHVRLMHHELASRAAISDVYDAARFQGRWATRFLKGDPFFNPALSTDGDDFAPQIEPIEILHVNRPLVAREQVRAILAVKVDHIGDFVISLPALRRLKQRFPDARLCVVGAKASGTIAAMEPAIDEFIEFNFFHARSGTVGTLVDEEDLLRLGRQLRSRRFDLAVDLRMQGETRHVLRRSGATMLAGFDHAGRFPWLDVAVEWEGDQARMPKRAHAGERLLQLVEAVALACEAGRIGLGDAPDPAEARRRLPALLRAALPGAGAAEALLDRPLVCVHPGVGSEMRQWPATSFAGLIDILVAEHGVRVALIGVGEEVRIGEEVVAAVARPDAVIPLLGKMPLQDLPTLLRACRLYVGNNSGPQHLAAALGVPVVGIHSRNVEAAEWAPCGPRAVAIHRKVTCGPCYISNPSDCHRGLFCLRSIRPMDVYSVCREFLWDLPSSSRSAPIVGLVRG